jgi:enediyne biosynthesis protein E4
MRLTFSRRVLVAATLVGSAALPALADGGVTFTDIALNGGAGVTYAHKHPADRIATFDAIRNQLIPLPPVPNFFPNAQVVSSTKQYGSPGLVAFDYDKDGDIDLYVANGPGRANSLFQNQFAQTGQVTFVDVAAAAGVEATAQDTNGVCYADIDNDGDDDLFLTAAKHDHILFRNNGDGTFTDISVGSGAEGNGDVTVGCSFGDIDGDGLSDLAIAVNLNDWNNRQQTFLPGDSAGLRHNKLYKNLDGAHFADVSASSGIENVIYRPNGSWTWVVTIVDIDGDGDQDIFNADMQGTPGRFATDSRGWNRLFRNDGTGFFTEVTDQVGLVNEGGWMGLAFADYDCNGLMDFSSSNVGDYIGFPSAPTSAFLQQPGGSFTTNGSGAMKRTPFGWGMVAADYDNDGDTDFYFQGGGDNYQATAADNPGALIQNTGLCTANFNYDNTAILRDHRPRIGEGVVVADLNNDGFDDFVSVASTKWIPTIRYIPYTAIVGAVAGSQFDAVARVQLNFSQVVVPGFFSWVGPNYEEGDLSVEINSAGNGNRSAQFTVVGNAGIARHHGDDPAAIINRNGFGTIVQFTPAGLPTSMRTVLGGESFASQNSPVLTFGMGATATTGTADITYPGGFKFRIYNVAAGEKLLVPTIPCNYETARNRGEWESCVNHALNDYRQAGLITNNYRQRLRDSARQTWNAER